MTFTVWHIALACVITAAVVAVVVAIHTRRRDIKKVNYMMDALEDGELNFRFQDTGPFNRTLNRIRTIFEKQAQAREQDSWTKLIRVLTHEIMNTVSPIASLSDALAKSVDEQGRSEMDLKAGLETISESSNSLIRFVETYRELSGVSRPLRKAVSVKDMTDGVISLNQEMLTSSGATCTCTAPLDLVIYADESQISRILINMMKNALQAGARHIDITAETGKDDVVILRVTNDGAPIPPAAHEQIFVPFYTTKPDGSGIGLALARQIMRQHDGTIDLVQSDQNQTVFELRFR
ncbi:MAG: HAMP domain-containing histidine kinase [Paludibacteraceae bacterium]|nr:HAMP domain-containing histidine kinase [Paludibacteraceae bacterium]